MNHELIIARRQRKRVAMGSLGWQEIAFIFIIALIVFGPRKLPEIGKTIGKGLAEFKKASNELRQTWEEEVRIDKEKESMTELIKESIIQPSDILPSDILKDDSNTEPSKDAGDSGEKKENQ